MVYTLIDKRNDVIMLIKTLQWPYHASYKLHSGVRISLDIKVTQSSLFKDDLGTLEDTVGSDTECPSKRGVRCVEIQRKGLKNERDQFLVSIVERVFYGLIVVLAKILLSQASRLRHLSKKGSDIPNQFTFKLSLLWR